MEPQRGGQCVELRGGEGAQRDECGVGLEACTHRAHLGDAPGEVLGEQPDDDPQDVMDQPDPALDPAHRSRELDRVGAQRIARRAQARGLLGVRHQASSRSERNHLFDLIEGAREPCGQAIGQQAEGGVAFGAVPASDSCPARGLARVGAVAGERTSPVRMIRTALEACIAPRLGPNVSLAGVPRFIPKLHRPWPGGRLPVRANSSLVRRNAETTTRAPQRQAVTMWTRPADRVDKAWTSARHLPTPCPHSALSRPHPHRFCNNDSWKRQRHRRRPVPALLRHPRKSAYGILRPIPAVFPRGNARNNSGEGDRAYLGRPASCSEFGTEGTARGPDHGAGVSRRHSRSCSR